MTKFATIGVFLLSVCACKVQTDPISPSPSPKPERPIPPSQDSAKDVCDAWRRLGCEEGGETPEGVSCETVVRNAADEGIDLAGDVTCIVKAESCAQARKCE